MFYFYLAALNKYERLVNCIILTPYYPSNLLVQVLENQIAEEYTYFSPIPPIGEDGHTNTPNSQHIALERVELLLELLLKYKMLGSVQT